MLTVAPASPQAPGAAEGEAAAAPGAVRGAEGTGLRAGPGCVCRPCPCPPDSPLPRRSAGCCPRPCCRSCRSCRMCPHGEGAQRRRRAVLGSRLHISHPWAAPPGPGLGGRAANRAFVALGKGREWELKTNVLPSLCSAGPLNRLRQMTQVRYSLLC